MIKMELRRLEVAQHPILVQPMAAVVAVLVAGNTVLALVQEPERVLALAGQQAEPEQVFAAVLAGHTQLEAVFEVRAPGCRQ
jgi:hypothetical protein